MAIIPFKYRDAYYTFKATVFIRNEIDHYKITDLTDESGTPIAAAGYFKQEISITGTPQCLKPDRETNEIIDPVLILSITRALEAYLTSGGIIKEFDVL
jgi:hypothetical protein